jgi:hypothetical protein
MDANVRFGVYVPVGPGDEEVRRARDLLESLFFHEPDVTCLVFVDDSVQDRDLRGRLKIPGSCAAVCIPHPRRGKGKGHFGAQFAANLIAASWLRENAAVDFMVKLDTDAIVAGRFAQQLRCFFARHPEAGLTGVIGRTSDSNSRYYRNYGDVTAVVKTILRLLPPNADGFWLERHQAGLHCPGLGYLSGPELLTMLTTRNDLETALRNGYPPGEYMQGGAYAISHALIAKLAQLRTERDLECWHNLPIAEDVLMGMYAWVFGLGLMEYQGGEKLFAVQDRGLPGMPEDLLAQHHTILHSLKNDSRFSEMELRTFFANRRAISAGTKGMVQ